MTEHDAYDEYSRHERRGKRIEWRKIIRNYAFLLPSIIVTTLFVLLPIFFAFIVSIYKNPSIDELRNQTEYYSNLDNVAGYPLHEFMNDIGKAGYDALLGFVVAFGLTVILFKQAIARFKEHEAPPRTYILGGLGIAAFSFIIGPLSVIGLFRALIMIKLPFEPPLEDYAIILTSERIDFVRILFNTVFWTFTCVFFHVALGIFLALILNKDF
ncbi:MAG: hypothetical protein ACFFGZ_17295, partial [Candidatus Thorarchaeota archaeon]